MCSEQLGRMQLQLSLPGSRFVPASIFVLWYWRGNTGPLHWEVCSVFFFKLSFRDRVLLSCLGWSQTFNLLPQPSQKLRCYWCYKNGESQSSGVFFSVTYGMSSHLGLVFWVIIVGTSSKGFSTNGHKVLATVVFVLLDKKNPWFLTQGFFLFCQRTWNSNRETTSD